MVAGCLPGSAPPLPVRAASLVYRSTLVGNPPWGFFRNLKISKVSQGHSADEVSQVPDQDANPGLLVQVVGVTVLGR